MKPSFCSLTWAQRKLESWAAASHIEHARQERIFGHVAAHPEFAGLDVLVADHQLVLEVEVDDRRELLHLEPLGIAAANSFPIDENTRGVDGGGVDQRHWRHARFSFLDFSAVNPRSARRSLVINR